MSLEFSAMSEDDIHTFVDVDELAWKDDSFMKAMASEGQTRRELVSGLMLRAFKADDNYAFLKVVDTEFGELISGAMWHFQLEAGDPTEEQPVSLPVDVEEAPSQDISAAKARSFMETVEEQILDFKTKFIGTQPHIALFILSTHPQHQRRGAASMLIKWGCEKADEHGVIAVVHSSLAGFKLYLDHGFELVDEMVLDLTPWGIHETTIRRAMIRQPQATATAH